TPRTNTYGFSSPPRLCRIGRRVARGAVSVRVMRTNPGLAPPACKETPPPLYPFHFARGRTCVIPQGMTRYENKARYDIFGKKFSFVVPLASVRHLMMKSITLLSRTPRRLLWLPHSASFSAVP